MRSQPGYRRADKTGARRRTQRRVQRAPWPALLASLAPNVPETVRRTVAGERGPCRPRERAVSCQSLCGSGERGTQGGISPEMPPAGGQPLAGSRNARRAWSRAWFPPEFDPLHFWGVRQGRGVRGETSRRGHVPRFDWLARRSVVVLERLRLPFAWAGRSPARAPQGPPGGGAAKWGGGNNNGPPGLIR